MRHFSTTQLHQIRCSLAEVKNDSGAPFLSSSGQKWGSWVCSTPPLFYPSKPTAGSPGDPVRAGGDYSYRSASAGSTRAADCEGYTVAMKLMASETTATSTASSARGTNGT